jgi:type I restriction enzyme, R subunit
LAAARGGALPRAPGLGLLGDWSDRESNSSIEEDVLRRFLREKQGYDDGRIKRALYLFRKAAQDTSKRLYDRR